MARSGPKKKATHITTSPVKTPPQWETKGQAEIHAMVLRRYDAMLDRMMEAIEREILRPAEKAATRRLQAARQKQPKS